jgi:2-amino-4-hydroxy-6-hydroxymethyldihydropteridine diphosphokinase
MVRAYVGIGSNLGDRLRNCANALGALGGLPGTRVVAASPFFETEPEDGAGPQWFVNVVAVLGTALAPGPLLAALQELEGLAGRAGERARGKNRTLDLDVLLYGDQVLQESALTVPHPRLHQRRFVLVPLCAVAPDVVHPTLGRTMRELLAMLGSGPAVRLVEPGVTRDGLAGVAA